VVLTLLRETAIEFAVVIMDIIERATKKAVAPKG